MIASPRVGWRTLRPLEYLLLGFAVTLAAMAAYERANPLARFGLRAGIYAQTQGELMGAHLPLVVGAGLLFPAFVAAFWRKNPALGFWRRWLRGLRDFSIFATAYFAYVVLRDWVPMVRSTTVDVSLAGLDRAIFGCDLFRALPRWWPESVVGPALMFCYLSYFYVPIAIGLWLHVRRAERHLRMYMLALGLTCLMAYVGYVLVPAVGPRYAFASETGSISTIDDYAALARDAFPSLHVAWAAVGVIFLWRLRSWLAWPAAALTVGIAVAAIYFGYHYFVDLPAGVAVAWLACVAARRIDRRWFGRLPRDLEGAGARR